MFVPQKGSHHIGLHSRFSKNTGIKCTSDRIQPEIVLSYLGFHDGNYLEDGGWQAGPLLGDDKNWKRLRRSLANQGRWVGRHVPHLVMTKFLVAPLVFPCKSRYVGWQVGPSLGDVEILAAPPGFPCKSRSVGW